MSPHLILLRLGHFLRRTVPSGLSPRGRIIWRGPTRSLELWMGRICALRGAWMLVPWFPPHPISGYLPYGWSTEAMIGGGILALGLVQWYGAGRRGWRRRGMVATALVMTTAYLILAYGVQLLGLRVVPLALGLVWAEMWIAWRAWHDAGVSLQLVDRRSLR